MILSALSVALAAPVLLAAAYLGTLGMLARRGVPPRPASRPLRFDLLVPAHDEEADISRAVASLAATDYPPELRRILVVADNCRDRTAPLARAAGAVVWVHRDPKPLGKGGALAYGFSRSLADGFADAVVVTDADTVVSRGLLNAFAARIEAGAEAVQAHYAVANPRSSWRTELAALGFSLFHGVRSLARDALGLSCGLRGNGMCFTSRALRAVPYRAFSRVEDLEYGLALGEAGIRVRYAPEAVVRGDMPTAAAAARSQRLRWEDGRRELARGSARRLFLSGVRSRNPVLIDFAIDLWVPTLARLTGASLAGTLIAAAAWLGGVGATALIPWLAADAMLAIYFWRGWSLMGTGWRGLGVLAHVPRYLLWKASLVFQRSRPGRVEWVRTAREGR